MGGGGVEMSRLKLTSASAEAGTGLSLTKTSEVLERVNDGTVSKRTVSMFTSQIQIVWI